ncbi:MAG TPA: ArsI/CadI family heavy metal resistance metalloenzyme [Acidimicrobiales bacterium]|nr:MAG: glyoxalase/bleomycin resistance/dioxygenase family protein [Actinobacteria bacterium 21-64-8]HQT99609.1 ArsI/CadI family heavy metal resistance metalloenzyme [Acidimicrobiales bacterium]
MSRLQLALNVSNLEESIAFYTKYFNTPPAKVRPGYANFAIAEPPLKLVLFENEQKPGSINHLGVEVFSTNEVVAATRYFASQGLETEVEDGTVCCHALQDKVWVHGPDGARWETYTVLADASEPIVVTSDSECCVDATYPASACC